MKNELNENMTVRFACIQGFYWMSFAVVMGFSSVYLLDMGFTNTQIGVIVALGGAISAILQPILASYADRPKSWSVKQLLLLLSSVIFGIGILLLILYKKSLFLTGMLFGCVVVLLQLLTPFVNALGMESINQGKKLNFGAARGVGSGAYGVGAFVLGRVVAKTGTISIAAAMVLVYGALLVCVAAFPFEKKKVSTSVKEENKAGIFSFFFRYKRFSFVLLGCVLIHFSHLLLNNYLFQIVESKGGGSSELGIAMAVASLVELPVLFSFSYLLKKAGSDLWFRISGIFFAVKALGSLVVPTVTAFYGVQMLQIFAWGIFSVSAIYYVNQLMDQQDAIKGQAYFTMTYTLGSLSASLVGGAVIDHWGVNAMIIASVVTAVLGMLILLFGTEKVKK